MKRFTALTILAMFAIAMVFVIPALANAGDETNASNFATVALTAMTTPTLTENTELVELDTGPAIEIMTEMAMTGSINTANNMTMPTLADAEMLEVISLDGGIVL